MPSSRGPWTAPGIGCASLHAARGDTEETVWSGLTIVTLPDVLTSQSEVATAILREVEAAVRPQPPAWLSPANGRRRLRRLSQGAVRPQQAQICMPADVQESIRLFEGVILRDATSAQAHAGLAAAYQASGATSIGALPVVDTHPRRPPTRPLGAGPRSAALGSASHPSCPGLTNRVVALAVAELHHRSAIAVDVNDASARIGIRRTPAHQGRIEEGLALARTAARSIRCGPIRTVRPAWLLDQARRYDEAIRELRTVLAADPDQVQALWFLGFARDRGIPVRRGGADGGAGRRGVGSKSGGALTAGEGLCAGRSRRGRRRHHRRAAGGAAAKATCHLVYVHADLGTGDNERALDALERAYQEHSNIVRFLKTHPLFDPIAATRASRRCRARSACREALAAHRLLRNAEAGARPGVPR